MPVSVAVACANFALCKYWGKSDPDRNLPAVPSLSMTVDALRTRTNVELLEGQGEDRIVIDGRPATGEAARRVTVHLDRLGRIAGVRPRMAVTSDSTFAAAAGLASSASAFAALTAAAARAVGLDLGADALSDLARQASASAARSVHGGFVELPAAPSGTDFLAAHPVPVASGLELGMSILITSESPKSVGSRDGMTRTAATSPYHEAWVRQAPAELVSARAALASGDLGELGAVMERSALRMHASAMAADPGLLYWNAATVEAIHAVRRLREGGVEAYFTVDAGPNVKVLHRRVDSERVRAALGAVAGVLRIIEAGVGQGVEVA
ncbi:MAG: diphosphomevalonate decarboxylase [Deltaproteobacteria bacterium]|nr:diphosphomevalonate decarboxylase [Deltaproteobacteria bacterium]